MAGKFNLAEHIHAAQPSATRDIEVITAEILDAKRRAVEDILTIGRGLIEAKALLSHGEWLPWLEERVDFSETTAKNYMQLARRFPNRQSIGDLGYTKALALLALPEKSMDEFIEVSHMVDGEEKTVSEMSVRELKAAIKERDEALKAAEQAKADQKAADEAREQLAQDIFVANERIKGLNAEVEQLCLRDTGGGGPASGRPVAPGLLEYGGNTGPEPVRPVGEVPGGPDCRP